MLWIVRRRFSRERGQMSDLIPAALELRKHDSAILLCLISRRKREKGRERERQRERERKSERERDKRKRETVG